MKPSLEKLHKFFKLEAERGYDNRAVVGGLDRMLGPWQAEAQADGLIEDLIQAVIMRLRDYPNLTPSSRAEILDGLWRRIQRDTDEELSPLPSPTPETQVESRKHQEIESAESSPATPKPQSPDTKSQAPKSEIAIQETPPILKEESAALDAPLTVLWGIGPRHRQTLSRLGLYTLGDMLYFFPRRYDDYSKLKPINRLQYGEEVTIIGTIESVISRSIRSGRMKITEAIVGDGSGTLRVSWFNQPWLAKRLRNGTQVVLSGKIDQYLGRPVMSSPEWELLDQQHLHTNRIVPVYPLTANVTQRWLRRQVHQVITYWAPRILDPLPEWIRLSANLVELSTALLQVHFPDSEEDLKTSRHRLAFDEIFLLQLGVLQQKRAWQERSARIFDIPDEWLQARVDHLPFRLTEAQHRALADVRADLLSGHPMNRLLQGDVGSGKTVIAALAIAMLTRFGVQAALMAPTSILAEQHYKNMLHLLADEAGPLRDDQICLMLGATPEPEKRSIRAGLESGEIKLVIGTHALIEDPIVFKDLQLVVVDEQHRFGVEQRALLRSKGENPHLLVMTATPIPRSLSLTIYGDLDLSVIDELPPGRQATETQVFYPRERERAYTLIHSQLQKGHQAFIIYPLVEESEKSESLAAVEEYTRLQKEVFPNHNIGLLHGRLPADEKEAVMAQFRDMDIHILVSTSVVEVGVDVPNATVMLVEGANRFGLAQLHQFRGRVGRGQEKAYCILIPETPDEVENERLAAMSETNDGFILAERDLEQRGPGEFLGTRQSGFSELRFANLTDIGLIEKARRQSRALFEQDPDLTKNEHHLIATTLKQFWGGGKGDIS